MDKAYDPQSVESTIYHMWESGGYFQPTTDKSQPPFSILLPPPNANADLHLGHAMYVVEDILVRYRRMLGNATLWLPGADHAGFETQFVYEKHLAKEGKSRFDFDRETLYHDIWSFVQENRGKMENQLRRLGFSLDWSRNIFTMDPEVVKIVHQTFKKLYDAGLIYRAARLVNYCTRCGTGFSDLEVKHIEKTDPLYYIKYGPFVLATVRPETKFGDTAVAVNPKDKRYQKWIGQEIEVEGLLGKFQIKVIADTAIDPKFGTGVAKVTPAHDFTDFEIGKRHDLALKQVIGLDGRLTGLAGIYAGLKVKAAREKVATDMNARGLIDHTDHHYSHTVATCYKCGSVLEPLPLSQWYVKVQPLATKAAQALKKGQINIVPKRFEKQMLLWLKNFHDWNISRQIVWGIRIPAWKCLDCEDQTSWIVTDGASPTACPTCGSTSLQQDPDTFDTWFSSGQWPYATLKTSDVRHRMSDAKENSDFARFYPTSVMETAYDILPWWVCRMIMLGLYSTDQIPFRTVYYHGLVRDSKGQKMSKSKGNVINPLKMIDQYGADALRLALVYGTGAGNDQALSEDKIRGMRNFANKLWNIGRFIQMNLENTAEDSGNPRDSRNQKVIIPIYDSNLHKSLKSPSDRRIITELNMLVTAVTKYMENYHFSEAAQRIYDFTWHRLADIHLEKNKERFKTGDEQSLVVLIHVYKTILKLLHPFMPFVTEAIYQQIPGWDGVPLIVTRWPTK